MLGLNISMSSGWLPAQTSVSAVSRMFMGVSELQRPLSCRWISVIINAASCEVNGGVKPYCASVEFRANKWPIAMSGH